MPKVGVYVHIPFCLKKCAYCDFYSRPFRPLEIEAYLQALKQEIRRFKVEGYTLFIGGGTPSVVPPSLLAMLVENLNDAYGPFIESTVEVNPKTVDKDYLQTLLAVGIDRLSIGVQSFNDETLKAMGRVHNKKDAIETVLWAKEVGFNNISIDLIYGYPHTNLQEVENMLKEAVNLPVDHISYYGLQIEKGTELYNSEVSFLDDEEYVKMYYLGIDLLENYGFRHYEISNFAKDDKVSKHNLLYWHNLEYLGLGASAVSRIDRMRYHNISSIEAYIAKMKKDLSVREVDEVLTEEILLKENIMLGLRLKEGVGPENLFGNTLNELYPKEVGLLMENGLLEKEDNRFKLSRKGLPLMNSVISCFF